MADVNDDNKDTNDDEDEVAAAAKKAADELTAKRREKLSARATEAARVAAESAARQGEDAASADADNKFGVDVSGVEDESLRGDITDALTEGKKSRKAAASLAKFGMQQAVHAAALEVAIELGMLDDVKDIEYSLQGARTPAELDLAKREIRLELAGESASSKPGSDGDKPPVKGEGSGRRFDGGRGKGSNKSAKLIKSINDIDPSDPEASKKLDELFGEVMQTQERYSARSS